MNFTPSWQNYWARIINLKTQIMETFNSEKLSSYQIDHQKLVTGLRPIQMPKVTQQNLAER